VPLAVIARAPRVDALVAMQCAGTVTTVALLLLSEGFKRSIYTNVALALAIAGPLATLAFARFLERDA